MRRAVSSISRRPRRRLQDRGRHGSDRAGGNPSILAVGDPSIRPGASCGARTRQRRPPMVRLSSATSARAPGRRSARWADASARWAASEAPRSRCPMASSSPRSCAVNARGRRRRSSNRPNRRRHAHRGRQGARRVRTLMRRGTWKPPAPELLQHTDRRGRDQRARLTKVQATKVAQMAHDGFARDRPRHDRRRRRHLRPRDRRARRPAISIPSARSRRGDGGRDSQGRARGDEHPRLPRRRDLR